MSEKWLWIREEFKLSPGQGGEHCSISLPSRSIEAESLRSIDFAWIDFAYSRVERPSSEPSVEISSWDRLSTAQYRYDLIIVQGAKSNPGTMKDRCRHYYSMLNMNGGLVLELRRTLPTPKPLEEEKAVEAVVSDLWNCGYKSIRRKAIVTEGQTSHFITASKAA